MFHVRFADSKKQLTQKEASFWETSSDGEVQQQQTRNERTASPPSAAVDAHKPKKKVYR